jgi:hypothetical protein
MDKSALQILLLAACVLTAGCGGIFTQGDTNGTDVSETENVPNSESKKIDERTTDGIYHQWDFRAERVTESDIVSAGTFSRSELQNEVIPRGQDFVSTLFQTGTASRLEIGSPGPIERPGPFKNGPIVTHNGSYYELQRNVTHENRANFHSIGIDSQVSDDLRPVSEEDVIEFSELSSADKELFLYGAAKMAAEDSKIDGTSFSWVFSQNRSIEESDIVNENASVVRYNNELYEVEYSRTVSPLLRQEVQYEMVLVASNNSEFKKEYLDQLVTQITDSTLSGPEREVILKTLQESSLRIEGHDVRDGARDARNWIATRPLEGKSVFVEHNDTLYRIEYEHSRRE